jgi:hypothetical protein
MTVPSRPDARSSLVVATDLGVLVERFSGVCVTAPAAVPGDVYQALMGRDAHSQSYRGAFCLVYRARMKL